MCRLTGDAREKEEHSVHTQQACIHLCSLHYQYCSSCLQLMRMKYLRGAEAGVIIDLRNLWGCVNTECNGSFNCGVFGISNVKWNVFGSS